MKTTISVKTGTDRRWRAPTVTAYKDEDELRMLLKDSPELPTGEDASRPVVLAHEFPVTFGSVDLVGVSPTGAITVVECKLQAMGWPTGLEPATFGATTWRRDASRA
jgi:RecB family endonuclease NucS